VASLRAEYERDVDAALARSTSAPVPLGDSDLNHLPPPVQQYVRRAGAVGAPRVRNLRARIHGRIRSGRTSRWIPLSAQQFNFFDEPARMFYLTGSMLCVPVRGYHRYIGASATMQITAAGMITVANAAGPEMDQSETVTMFNDMCLMAPAALIDPTIRWEAADARTARAAFTNAGHTIHAELSFDAAGDLIGFRSYDRCQAAPDGRSFSRLPWSTPIRGYRTFGGFRLPGGGEGRWHDAHGEYAYIELTIDEVAYNVRAR